jgi:hypothetical protein
MNPIQTLASVLGLSFVSGIDLYATVLVVGLGIRYRWVSGLPSELDILGHPLVLAIACVLYLAEFFADKVPVVSTAWDALHTFIRPIGGALLALGAAANLNPALQTIAFLAGGTIAFGTHSTKMGLRMLAHHHPEPVTHSAISILEDLGVVGLLMLVNQHPLAAILVVIACLALIVLLGPLLFRTIIMFLRGVAGRAVFWNSDPPIPPAWLSRLIAESGVPARCDVYPAFARSVPGAPRVKKGFLLCADSETMFAWRSWFRSKTINAEALHRSKSCFIPV